MKMTIDEAIRHYLEAAEEQSKLYSLCPCPCDGTKDCMCLENGKDMGCTKCSAENRQIAEWLMKLKEAKRLLKAAVDDICALRKGANCNICAMPQTDAERKKRCDPTNGQDCRFIWCYAKVIEKIIGDEQHESTLPYVQET